MKAKSLLPHPVTRKRLGRCTAMRDTRYLTDTPESDYQCTRKATVELDGVPFCALHGGQIALAYLLKQAGENVMCYEDERDESAQCPMCGGEGLFLGRLARLLNYRCRHCGMVFQSDDEGDQDEAE